MTYAEYTVSRHFKTVFYRKLKTRGVLQPPLGAHDHPQRRGDCTHQDPPES